MGEKLIFIAVGVWMVFFELIPLIKNGEKRLATAYTVLLSAAAVLFFLFDSDLKLPSISELIGNALR